MATLRLVYLEPNFLGAFQIEALNHGELERSCEKGERVPFCLALTNKTTTCL